MMSGERGEGGNPYCRDDVNFSKDMDKPPKYRCESTESSSVTYAVQSLQARTYINQTCITLKDSQ